jgi:anthranilate phosphoribosyltransferase
VRRELGIRTIFNILGPLVNPAGANMELLGVYSEELVEPLAKVLSNLGVNRALVVFGQDGLDEISVSANTSVCEVRDGFIRSYEMKPEDFGLSRCDKSELAGGTPTDNAAITRDILSGKERGAKRDAVLLNSAAAIHIAHPETSIGDALEMARALIDSGAAQNRLDEFIHLTNAKMPCRGELCSPAP